MNRQEKMKAIETLREHIIQSHGMFLVNYRGLSVPKIEALRAALRKEGGNLKVAKARLMKKAVEGKDAFEPLTAYFKDQVGLVFASGEVPGIAKVLRDFSQEDAKLEIIIGSMDRRLLSKDAVIAVASLPSRQVLLAQLCGLLKANIASFACVLNMVAQQKQQEADKN